MRATIDQTPIKASLSALLIAFCLILPNLHITALANQVVIPREFLLYLFSVVFLFLLSQKDRLRYNDFFFLSLCFVIWQALSLIWSTDRHTGVEDVLNAYVFLLAAYGFYEIRETKTLNTTLTFLIAAMTVACLIGLAQNFGNNPFGIHQARPPASTFNNKNLAASAALLFLPAALSKLALETSKLRKLAYTLSCASMLGYILVCHTKGVWLAALGLMGIALAIHRSLSESEKQSITAWLRSDRRHLVAIGLIALALFLAPGAESKDHLYEELNTFAEGSASIRLSFYQDSIPLVAQNPIAGIGSGSLRREFRAEPAGDYIAQHAQNSQYLTRLHNDHLQYLVEHGLVGLALWLSMLAVLYRHSLHYIKGDDFPVRRRVIVFSLLLGISGMLLHAMISFPLRTTSTGSLFWLAIGLTFAYQDHSNRALHLNRPLKYTLIALLLALSVFSVQNVMSRAIGSFYVKQASEALTNGYCFAAKFHLNHSMEVTRLDLYAAQLLAITYDHCKGENPEQIITIMNHILAFEPNHSLALVVKGDAAVEMDNTTTALESYTRALKVNPLEERAFIGAAKLEAEKGNTENAILLLKQVQEIGSGNETVTELLQIYQAR